MDDERIETRWFTKKELRGLIESNKILDSENDDWIFVLGSAVEGFGAGKKCGAASQ